MRNVSYLKKLKKKIEQLDMCHHTKILSIIKNNNINYSENKNGIFINMNLLNETIIQDIEKYIKYVDIQEKTLKKVENLKYDFKKEYFNKEDKEKLLYSN